MNLTKVQDALKSVTHLGLDTDAVIYFVQSDVIHGPLLSAIFSHISTGQITGVTSAIALTETLVRPIRERDRVQKQRIQNLLLHSANMACVSADPAIAEVAARLRAQYNMRTPDAIHAATAITAKCEAFLTNNGSDFRRVSELNVLVLSEMEL